MNSVDQTSQHPTYILPDFPVGERERKPNIKDSQVKLGSFETYLFSIFIKLKKICCDIRKYTTFTVGIDL